MMRAPTSLAIAVRRANGEITAKEDVLNLVGDRFPFLKWPLVRGTIVLMESMVHGFRALNFSAEMVMDDEYPDRKKSTGNWALVGTLVFAVVFGLGLFVALPHVLAYWAGKSSWLQYGVDSVAFHLVDGAIKLALFLAYVKGISMLKDIRRIFEYHGAEHKAIYAYENGDELILENARKYPTLHPRCGTSFLLLVLLISILLFSVVFPLLSVFSQGEGGMRNVWLIGVKILLMFPVAGLSYEAIRWGAKHMNRLWVRLIMAPGLWLQKLTTLPPTDDQLEVALVALRRVLSMETGKKELSSAIV